MLEMAKSFESSFELSTGVGEEDVKVFCQNAASSGLEMTAFRDFHSEMTSPNLDDMMAQFWDEDSCVQWYVAIRAAEEFNTSEGRYPGDGLQTDFEADAEKLILIGKEILTSIGGETISDDYFYEMYASNLLAPDSVNQLFPTCVL